MSGEFVSRPNCILSIIVLILLVSSTGLLVMVLKGDYAHPHDSNSSHHHHHHHHSQNATTQDVQSDQAPGSNPDEPWRDFRLPDSVRPIHYDLELEPDLEKDQFSGKVDIEVNVTRRTRYFLVHVSPGLNIRHSSVRQQSNLQLEKKFSYERNEFFVMEVTEEVDIGVYKLFFNFNGRLDGGIVGFYTSRYRNSRKEIRSLATSKFQPTYARRAFPCFDEPGFKATFNVSLVHGKDYTALSNMPPTETKPLRGTNLYRTTFMKSVPMVTYLTCFIVCDFHYKELITSSGKPFRVYSHPDAVNTTTYALQTGYRILEYFEKYFGIDYPLPKIDLIAIPDFPSGASEHWGLITFREERLLYDPASSSPADQQRIAAIIAHELVHMWFGNLVTMEWWDDLWLNEGFASYVEYMGVDAQHPEWDINSQFLIEDLHPVMLLDSTATTHSIAQPVTRPSGIFEKFGKISYAKGASVVRMMQFSLGKENFKKGITDFLTKHQYQNAVTNDLWNELSSACGKQGNRSIPDIMNTWTQQVGFPHVTVRRKKSSFVAKQRRFLKYEDSLRQKEEDSTQKSIWSIPLSYRSSDGAEGIVWLHDDAETEFPLAVKDSEWLKFNVNQTGFYLVNYDKDDWEKLSDALLNNHEVLSPSDRSNLLFDSFLLGEAGHVGYDVFFTLAMYLKNETHYTPWKTAQTALQRISRRLDMETSLLLQDHIRYLTSDLYESLGWNTTKNHLDNLLRATIIDMACGAGSQRCLEQASQLFRRWTNGERIPAGVENLVYKFGMAEAGDADAWDGMWNKYLSEESPPAQKRAYLEGLAYVRDPALIQRYLSYIMNSGRIRYQDFNMVLSFLMDNPDAKKITWSFLNTVRRFPENTVKMYCEHLTSEDELKQMREFYAPEINSTSNKRFRLSLDEIQINIRWMNANHQHLKTWLESEGPPPWYHPRLPSHAVPLYYDLMLHPDLDRDRFSGSVYIGVQLQKPSNYFLVHSVDLNVAIAEVTSEGKDPKSVALEEVFKYKDHDYLVLKTKERLPAGGYKLYFVFEGLLTLSLKGLYKSSYVDPVRNETRYLATTQFESIDARRAFPCFDEPRFKATFAVSVAHERRHIALSNTMEESSTEVENGTLVTRFKKTPPMVTYLLAIVVCDFEYKETTTDNGVRLRIYTAPHHIEKTDYALQVGSRILTYYENYFDIPFPLDKLDMIAIPDFGSNGMENWGLVTYSEESLVCENTSTVAAKQHTVNIIGHELAHMWFGDLVTMEWWSDLWLNEGFATYMSLRGAKFVEPELDRDDERAALRLMRAMSIDQNVHSHPIVQPVTRVNSAIFDGITYMKGSAVLGMLENFMGEDFRTGVSAYLKKYSYANAETENLWDALTEVSREGVNVSTLMETWTHQMNYPFLTVQRNENASGSYTIRQDRYLAVPENLSVSKYSWHIPITYSSSQNNDTLRVLLNTTGEVEISLPDSDWVKLNYGFAGFYSVNYDNISWKKFIDILETNHTFFAPSDRLNLVFDALSLSSAGVLEYEVALNLTRYLRREEHSSAWRTFLTELRRIQAYFEGDDHTRDIIREYIRSLSGDLFKKYTWNDTDDYSERKLRKTLIAAACESGNQDCLLGAGRLFKQWMEGDELSSETKLLVLTYGLRVYGDSESWNSLWNRYLGENDPAEKLLLLNALPTIRNEDVLGRLLTYSKDVELVRKHDFVTVMEKVARNPKGQSLVLRLLDNDWDDLLRNHGVYQTERFAKSIFSQYKSQKDLEKVREFYKKHPKSKDTGKQRSLAIENIQRNIHWIKNHGNSVRKWFQDNVYMPWKTARLPPHVAPVAYNITLWPDIAKGGFEGDVGIELDVTRSTDCILVHQSGLRISSVQLTSLSGGNVVDIEEVFPYERNQFHVVRLRGEVPSGRYVLGMKFVGEFAVNGRGMGRYQYTDRITKEVRYMCATQFEPTDARRVFPCLDEPAFKATFHLSVVHPSDLTALSNMPEEEKVPLENGLVKTVFMPTVVMPTYLLFSAVSDFGYLQTDHKGKQVRAYAPPDRLLEAEHGLNLTVRILEKLENYFGIPYPLPKLDSVVIPEFIVPGMENWGAIAYGNYSFLVDGRVDVNTRVQDVDWVIAHELVHQWIGNLVTMEWWNDLWLKEGLSSLVMLTPLRDYDTDIDKMSVRQVSNMMCVDSTLESHPVVVNATTPEEIMNTFDAVSYEKGAAVLKMLQHTLKEDFQTGITNYLKKYAYRNAQSKDLWAELSNATSLDVDVAEVMDTWTRQIGFPCVELQRRGDTVTATQQWFVRRSNQSAAAEIARRLRYAPFGFIWKIPLVYKNLRTGNEHTYWLNNKNATFQINATSEDVVKFNPGFVGFYIVKYEPYEWAKLGHRLRQNHLELSVADRYNLLHDAFLLADSGRLPHDIPLRLSRYLVNEIDSLPWSLFRDRTLGLMRRLGEGSETFRLLKAYVADLTAKSYDDHLPEIQNKIYFKNWKNNHRDCFHAYPNPDFLFTLVELACRASNEKCLGAMKEELQLWMLGKNITADLRLVLELAIPRYGNSTLWQHLYLEVTSNDTSEDAKHLMAEGLTLFTDPTLVTKTIVVMAQDPGIGPDLAQLLFKNLAENPVALPLLWEYTKDHWHPLMTRLAAKNNPSFGLSTFCEKFKTSGELNKIVQFMKSISEESRGVSEGCIANIQERMTWSEEHEEAIATWLMWNVNK